MALPFAQDKGEDGWSCHPTICNLRNGCGLLGSYTCNGLCVYTEPPLPLPDSRPCATVGGAGRTVSICKGPKDAVRQARANALSGASFCRDRAMWVKRLLSLLLFFKRREYRCSFCNAPQSAVRQLIAGSSAFICDECVAVCDGVVAQDATTPGERRHATNAIAICLICKRGKPESECILVPTRGPVCVQCVETVKAAAASLSSATISS